MQKIRIMLALLAALCVSQTASANDILTGDTRLACEAMLCLASGSRPGECAPSIRKYFSIKASKPHRTLRKRLNFLNLCPVGDGGDTAARVQRVYGQCDMGYVSTNCAQLGYTAIATAGFCTVRTGERCNTFVAGNYLDAEGNVAQDGDYGLCYRNTQPRTPFGEFEPFDRNGCFRFVAQIPEDFGASDAAAELTALGR